MDGPTFLWAFIFVILICAVVVGSVVGLKMIKKKQDIKQKNKHKLQQQQKLQQKQKQPQKIKK